MHWLLYLALFTIAFSIKDIVRKRSLNRFDNMAVLSLEFGFTALYFFIVALALRIPLTVNVYTLTFLGIGILHGLGTAGKINAMNVSLSKTTLFSKYFIFAPMLLGAIFLNEAELLNIFSASGALKTMALMTMPVSLLFLQKRDTELGKQNSKVWLWSMAQFFIFHAFLEFMIKLNIKPDVVIQAAVFQRSSAAIVTILAAKFSKAKFPLRKQLFVVSMGNALLITISSFSSLSALTTAPLLIYKPLEKMLTMIVITAFGLVFFKEHLHLSKKEKRGYLVTIIGASLLIVSEIFDIL